MNCLNTYNCNNEAVSVKETNCSNFCSYSCSLVYKGKEKPSIPKRKTFEDPERQQIHDLYIWARTDIDPRKPYRYPKKRGVKKGTKRGSYKTKEKKNKNRKLYQKKCLDCNRIITTSNKRNIYCDGKCKQRSYRQRKAKKEIERKKAIMSNVKCYS